MISKADIWLSSGYKIKTFMHCLNFFLRKSVVFSVQTFALLIIDLHQKAQHISKIITTFVPTTENHE